MAHGARRLFFFGPDQSAHDPSGIRYEVSARRQGVPDLGGPVWAVALLAHTLFFPGQWVVRIRKYPIARKRRFWTTYKPETWLVRGPFAFRDAQELIRRVSVQIEDGKWPPALSDRG